VDAQVSSNNFDTMRWIGVIAFLGVVLVVASGLVLSISERHAARVEEQVRLAGELHDDICQRLVSAILLTKTGIIQLRIPEQFMQVQHTFERAAAELNKILRDTRNLGRKLYSDTTALAPSLHQLAGDMQPGLTPIDFTVVDNTENLSVSVNEVLFRVAQGALRNVMEHAAASQAWMRLEGDKRRVVLTIRDNGTGFDTSRLDTEPEFGMSLRNMEKRLEKIGGHLDINSTTDSTTSGTTITATVPISLLRYLLNLLNNFSPKP
jgi:two-component system NarL family sensor kinase